MWQGESKPAQGRAGQQGQPEDKGYQALEDDQGEDDPIILAHVALNNKTEDDNLKNVNFELPGWLVRQAGCHWHVYPTQQLLQDPKNFNSSPLFSSTGRGKA